MSTYPRVSHLSDARQTSGAINQALRKTDALGLSSDQLTATFDRDLSVTGDLAATGNISGVGATLTADLAAVNVDLSGVYKKGAVQVVGARVTGWTAATGTPARGAFAAAAAGIASAGYVQAELQGALNRIAALEARLIAYDADLRTHGLIGT